VKAVPFVRGFVGRLLSYASFYLLSALRSLTIPKPDLVLTLTTPPLLSLLGTLLKVFRGSRHFVWEMDVYPDVAISLGYFKGGGMAEQISGALADFSRRHSDGIIALGECMKDLLVGRGIAASKIFVADNWADGRSITPMPRDGDSEKLVLLYSGNLGLAHDLETIEGAMLNLRMDETFQFLFVGSGGRRRELEEFCFIHEIHSVELRPYVQRSDLSHSLAAGDIGLVTQRDSCCGSVVPSKIYGLLAAGRPILFIGPRGATPARIIQQFACGWQIDCGDVDGLTDLLQHLAANREEVEAAAKRARQTLVDHYDLPLGVARIVDILGAGPTQKTSLLKKSALASGDNSQLSYAPEQGHTDR
jgi:glycosyltransferase involved in cell wall biosynthesis